MATRYGLIHRSWHLFDGKDQIVGRLAGRIAWLLAGKHKPTWKRHLDDGDHVFVINADKIRFSRNRAKHKIYYTHSGYPGGLKASTAERMLRLHPDRVLRNAVKGMLARTKARKQRLRRLRLYTGDVDVRDFHPQFKTMNDEDGGRGTHIRIFPRYEEPIVEVGFELPDEEIPDTFDITPTIRPRGALPEPFDSLGKYDIK